MKLSLKSGYAGPAAWGALTVALFLAVIGWGEMHPEFWRAFGVFPMQGSFADMEALLAAGEAFQAGLDPYHNPNLFDTYNRPHVYGAPFLVTGAMGLTVAHVAEAGVLVVAAWLGMVAAWMQSRTRAGWVVLWLLLFSPPVMLCLERANNDLVIALMVGVAAWLARRRGPVIVAGMGVLIAMTAWLKVYPAVGLLGLLALPGPRRVVLKQGVLVGLVTLVGFAFQAPIYMRILHLAPSVESLFTYNLLYSLRVVLAGVPGCFGMTWLGGLMAVGLSGWLLWPRRGGAWWQSWPAIGPWAVLLVSSGAIWVGCLVFGAHFAYRAIWLIPFAVWALRCASGRGGHALDAATARRLAVWLGCFLWSGWPQFQLLILFSREGGEADVGWFAIAVGFHHTFSVISVLVTGAMLAGWAVRRWSLPDVATRELPNSG